jgi:hypothetical protein
MTKFSFAVATIFLCLTGNIYAERLKCQDAILASDVIAQDFDANGNEVEYKRNSEDIETIIRILKTRISKDPSIRQTVGWEDRMLTVKYWEKERCGGTKNCETKECPSGNSCVYRSLGMSGCRCEKDK